MAIMMGDMEKGDVLGHEPMGVVVEVGGSVTKPAKGDRVVVAFRHRLRSLFLLYRSSSFPAATRPTRTQKTRAS